MTIKYLGESKRANEDRFAVITAKVNEEDMVVDILTDMGYEYENYGDSEEVVFYVPVDDKTEFNTFSKMFRKTRKEYK